MAGTKRYQKGRVIPAASLNQNARLQTTKVIGGRGVSVSGAGQEIVIDSTQPQRSAVMTRVLFAQVVSAQDDYVTCYAYNPVAAATYGTVYIAKPWYLRKTPINGQTLTFLPSTTIEFTYTSATRRYAENTSSGDAEYQVLTPPYIVGEILRVTGPNPTGVLDGSGNPILYEDMNVSGRTWAQEP